MLTDFYYKSSKLARTSVESENNRRKYVCTYLWFGRGDGDWRSGFVVNTSQSFVAVACLGTFRAVQLFLISAFMNRCLLHIFEHVLMEFTLLHCRMELPIEKFGTFLLFLSINVIIDSTCDSHNWMFTQQQKLLNQDNVRSLLAMYSTEFRHLRNGSLGG